MIVVADAGPLHYLVLIEAVDVLHALFDRVAIPQAVATELKHRKTPAAVRSWISGLPQWCAIYPDGPADSSLAYLDSGERAAIHLAFSLSAERLLMDEREGRAAAQARNLDVIGTVGVLAVAHAQGLLDFETSFLRLRGTNFYVSDELVSRVRRRLFSPKEDV